MNALATHRVSGLSRTEVPHSPGKLGYTYPTVAYPRGAVYPYPHPSPPDAKALQG